MKSASRQQSTWHRTYEAPPIGEMDKVMEYQEPTETMNKPGEPVPEWVTLRKCRAAVRPMSGREFMRGDQLVSDADSAVWVRLFPELRTKGRFKETLTDRIFNIKDIGNPGERRGLTLTEVICKEES